MANFDELNAEVANLTSVIDSAVALINGIAAKIEEAVAANDAGDNSQLASLASSVRAQADGLAAAVTANTPAAPEE
jgi:hypothetical protein